MTSNKKEQPELETHDFPKYGISLKYLLETFSTEIADNTRTSDLFKRFKTAKYGTSVVNHWLMNKEDGKKIVGPATVYIIHPWNYLFKEELLSCLENYLNKKEVDDVFVWIDLFSMKLSSLQRHLRNYGWWDKSFVEDLNKNFEEVVVAWNNWYTFEPLKRTWCIWEMYIAFVAQVPIAMALTLEQDKSLKNDIIDHFAKLVIALKDLDIEKSKCFDRRMKKRTLAAVRRHEESFESFNNTALFPVREWWVAQGYTQALSLAVEFENVPALELIKYLKFLNALSFLGRVTGNLEIAKDVAELSCKISAKHNNFSKLYPLEYARELNNLSVILTESEDVLGAVENGEKAIKNLKDYVIHHMKQAGEGEFDGLILERRYIATALNNQGNLLLNLEQYPLAVERYLESIQLKTELYGPDHILVAAGLNNLGLAYAATREHLSAERVYRQALQIRVRVLGLDDLQVAQTRHNLAEVLLIENHPKEANEEIKKAHAIAVKHLGKDHELTKEYAEFKEKATIAMTA